MCRRCVINQTQLIFKRIAPAGPGERNGKHKQEHEAGLAALLCGMQERMPAAGLPGGQLSGEPLTMAQLEAMLAVSAQGKPYLNPELTFNPPLYFNISHSADVAVCALGEREMGVDIERIRPVKLNYTRRILADHERRYLEQLDEAQRDLAFFRFWTLKESYAKAVGKGLALDFTKISFALGPGMEVQSLFPEGSAFVFFQMIWEQEYVLALCCAQDEMD